MVSLSNVWPHWQALHPSHSLESLLHLPLASSHHHHRRRRRRLTTTTTTITTTASPPTSEPFSPPLLLSSSTPPPPPPQSPTAALFHHTHSSPPPPSLTPPSHSPPPPPPHTTTAPHSPTPPPSSPLVPWEAWETSTTTTTIDGLVVVYDAPTTTTNPHPTTNAATSNNNNSGALRGGSEGDGSGCGSCAITLEERLEKTDTIWYLPDLLRPGAVHLLQGKDVGNFLVRKSSKENTLALTVRLPAGDHPDIQHYLVELHAAGTYSLEDSEKQFKTLPAFIAYYCHHGEELKVQLRLPRAVLEARTRHELRSLAHLGQEFWGTTMASPTAGSPPTPLEHPLSPAGPTPARPHDLAFTSFGKAGVGRGVSSTSLLSPQTLGATGRAGGSLASSVGGSTSSLAPVRPAPPVPPTPDRSLLNLNLVPHNEVFKDQAFSSFRQHSASSSQLKASTPVTRPSLPPRASPPVTQISPSGCQRPPPAKPTLPSRLSPPTPQEAGTPLRESLEGGVQASQAPAPAPPPRWAQSCLNTSPSNITVTTTLTFNVNQHKSLALQAADPDVTVHVANLEISPVTGGPVPAEGEGGAEEGQAVVKSGVLNGHREGLQLHIRQEITSPQSTPCTPLGEEVRLRGGRRDRRRLSTHYHEANIIDANVPCYRSSLADKISDYEDVWTTPTREVPSPTSPLHNPMMSTFKPSSEISKSMGDLSDVSQSMRLKPCPAALEAGGDTTTPAHTPDLLNGNVSIDNPKSTSPFYMEPADAVKELQFPARISKASSRMSRKVTNRYSDSNIQWKVRQSATGLGKGDAPEDIENLIIFRNNNGITSRFEEERNKNLENERNKNNAKHLVNGQDAGNARHHYRLGLGGRGKPIPPPRIARDISNNNMRVQEGEGGQCVEHKFPPLDTVISGHKTVQDLIFEKWPDLAQDAHSLAPSHTTRVSEYDNVGAGRHIHPYRPPAPEERIQPPLPSHYFASTESDTGTEFSEPWDSRIGESFMPFDEDSSLDQYPRSLAPTPGPHHTHLEDSELGCGAITDSDSFVHLAVEPLGVRMRGSDDDVSIPPTPTISLAHTNLDTQQRSRILSPQLLAQRHRQDAENGGAIRTYALDLGHDTSTTFSRTIANFLTCTLESTERDPAIVISNVRQFMSGMKNYLVTSGERQFETIVKQQQSTLKATEFLNLDAILEDVLVRLVLEPLKDHINRLFVETYLSRRDIQLLYANMKYARTQPITRLGVKAELRPPRGVTLDNILKLLRSMQHVYAPREKLESLLATISHIYHAMYEGGAGGGSGDADDLVPMIMWVLSQAEMMSAEVEAEYMLGLLLPSASAGEASYYLEAFQSAIHTLKNLTPSPDSSPGNSLDSVRQECTLVTEQGTVKIVIPDEQNGSIVTRTLPIRPSTTTREVCRMMAHKLKVTNPQDYALYKLINGHESLLTNSECPHKVKAELTAKGMHCTFAFKRMDAKIAWPILSS